MRGTFGILIGVVIAALGLAGLGVALEQMMSHSDPNAALKALAGLGVYVGVCLFALVLAR